MCSILFFTVFTIITTSGDCRPIPGAKGFKSLSENEPRIPMKPSYLTTDAKTDYYKISSRFSKEITNDLYTDSYLKINDLNSVINNSSEKAELGKENITMKPTTYEFAINEANSLNNVIYLPTYDNFVPKKLEDYDNQERTQIDGEDSDLTISEYKDEQYLEYSAVKQKDKLNIVPCPRNEGCDNRSKGANEHGQNMNSKFCGEGNDKFELSNNDGNPNLSTPNIVLKQSASSGAEPPNKENIFSTMKKILSSIKSIKADKLKTVDSPNIVTEQDLNITANDNEVETTTVLDECVQLMGCDTGEPETNDVLVKNYEHRPNMEYEEYHGVVEEHSGFPPLTQPTAMTYYNKPTNKGVGIFTDNDARIYNNPVSEKKPPTL